MKKSFIYAGAILAATISLTNCTKEVNAPETNLPEGIPFEIIASSSDTKTTVDGLSTKWAAGDAINVFHAAAGTTSYTSDNQFTIAAADPTAGRFTGSLSAPLADGAYDWYAFYPYSQYVTTPASTTTGYVTVGGTSQTQSGNNSMAHLSGKACPLYGVSKNVSMDAAPTIQMHHLTSIIAVKVTNNSGEEMAVNNVKFTAPEDIVGNYYINFASDPVAYTGSGSSYVRSTASLTVDGSEAIGNGESATFYLAVKPFKAASGDKLKLAVNGYEKELTLTKEISFSAGAIKTLSFDYDNSVKQYTIKLNNDLYGISEGNNATEQTATVSGITITSGCNSSATTKTNYVADHIRYYGGSYLKISVPATMGLTKLQFNEPSSSTKWDGEISVNEGTYDNTTKSWSGEATDLTFSFGKQNRIASVTFFYTGNFEIIKKEAKWSISPNVVAVKTDNTIDVAISTDYDGVMSVTSSDTGKATAFIDDKIITIKGVSEGSVVIKVTGPETQSFKAIEKEFSVEVSDDAATIETFAETYSYGSLSNWSLTEYEDKDSYYLVPKGDNPSLATIQGVFTGKTLVSDVVVTLNVATFSSGDNPAADTFSIFADKDCKIAVTAKQSGNLPTSKTFTNVIYTISKANVASFVDDLVIKIIKPGKQIRLKSINVTFEYTK